MKIKSEQLLLLFIIAVPGVFYGKTYISPTDAVIPLMYTYGLIVYPGGKSHKIRREYIPLNLYCFVCVLSVLFASLDKGSLLIDAFLKTFRLIEVLMVIRIIDSAKGRYKDSLSIGKLYDFIMIMSIIAGTAGIYLFLTQSKIFNPMQLMSINGQVMNRAEGFFGDAQTFSLMMSILFGIALANVFFKKKLILSYTSLIISFVAIIFSDTRAAFFAVIFAVFVFIVFRRKSKGNNAGILGYIAIGIVMLIIVYNTNVYVYRFLNERIFRTILAVFSGSYLQIAEVSSHRLWIWVTALDKVGNRGILANLIGSGYKVNMSDIADNQFIYSLLTTGILGFMSVIAVWVSIIKSTRKISKTGYSYSLRVLLATIMLVFMFLSDAMTLYRPMYLFFTLLEITGWNKNAITMPPQQHNRS